MSIHTDMNLDPDKTGVTLEELSLRAKYRKFRESLIEKGFQIIRYYSIPQGETIDLINPVGIKTSITVHDYDILPITNKELYDLWQNDKAKLIELSQADWDIEWEKPASNLSHEAIIEYQGDQYWLNFQDNFDTDGKYNPLIAMPNQPAHCISNPKRNKDYQKSLILKK